MKKIFTLLNVVLIVATLLGGYWYHLEGGILLKGTVCAGFALLGIVNLIFAICAKAKNRKFPALMSLGLILCMTGDIVLNIEFIPGALIFAVGHLFYFAAYCGLQRFRIRDLIPCILIFIASAMLITLAPFFDFGSQLMEGICIVYALVISCMCGKAISNLTTAQNRVTVLLTIGSLLFYFSDLMLVLHMFAGGSDLTDVLCLFTYFPAQCILAHSIYHFVNKEIIS